MRKARETRERSLRHGSNGVVVQVAVSVTTVRIRAEHTRQHVSAHFRPRTART